MNNEVSEANFYNATGLSKQTLELISTRRARRRLRSDVIPGDTLKRLLEAGRWAPSCANNQPWKYFLCVGEKAVTVREALLGGNYWADNVPAYIVAAVDDQDSCRLDDDRIYAPMDLGMSLQSILLQAHAEGLVAHPMAGMKPAKIKELLSIPENYRVMALVAIGFPGGDRELSERHESQEAVVTPRKPVEEMLFNPDVLEELN